MSMASFPKLCSSHPRGELPSWSRPGFTRRAPDVRRLKRDQFIEQLSQENRDALDESGTSDKMESARGAEAGGYQSKIVQLEKNIEFLKQQHRDTLQQLHKEIERLKTENRELNFKMIMCRCGRSGGKSRPGRHMLIKKASSGEETDPGTPQDELRIIFLEEEVRELRNALHTERSKNSRLMRVIEKKVLEHQKSSSFDQSDNESTSGHVVMNGVIGGTKPIHRASRPPTLEEYESVIRQLQIKNNQQSHELMQIKADLRDVLYSHKWTPDAYLIARAYVCDEEDVDKSNNMEGVLPKIATRSLSNKKTVERAYQRVKEEVSLPALRPKVPSMVAERHKRSQTIKNRLGRSLQ